MAEITPFIRDIISSQLFLLTLTFVAYYFAQLLYKRFPIIIFTPIILATSFIICFIKIADIEYHEYYEANSILNFLLGISVVCLSYLMHKNIEWIKRYRFSIIISTITGSIIGVVSIIGFAYLFGYSDIIMISCTPKSVTMPIALSVSEAAGGIPAITSLSVVVAGIFGNVIGVKIFQIFKITDPISRGLALGSASHAVGTAKAVELGALEGAIGGAAIGLMGVFTSLIIPILLSLKELF